jgi:hypothetical protein
VSDRSGPAPVDLPLEMILGKPPKMIRRAETIAPARAPLALGTATVAEALDRVLGLPTVADKSFLVSIGDRTVGGMTARDPMIGPYQVPVADHALTLSGFDTTAGEVMAIGERPPVALLDAAAASRLAFGEVVTNLASAPIGPLGRIKLSCNWMAAAGHPGEDARLYAAVRAASECAVALGMAIPVGKDSMSMRTTWGDPRVTSSERATPPPRDAIKSAAETIAAPSAKSLANHRVIQTMSSSSSSPRSPDAAGVKATAHQIRKTASRPAAGTDPPSLLMTGRRRRSSGRPPTRISTPTGCGIASARPTPTRSRIRSARSSARRADAAGRIASLPRRWTRPCRGSRRQSARRRDRPAQRGRDRPAVAAADALSRRMGTGPAGYVARGTVETRTLAPGSTRPSQTFSRNARAVVSPVTLIVTAFGPVTDVRLDVTPELRGGDRELLLIDLGAGKSRLGGSCLAQVYDQVGDTPPDLDDPQHLLAFYDAIQQLLATRKLAAYHDRSDGGLVVTLLEMAFAGGVGLELDTSGVHADPFAALFAEELGAVVEVATADAGYVRTLLTNAGARVHPLGRAVSGDAIRIRHGGALVVDARRGDLRKRWSHVTHEIALRRDDPACADEEHASRIDPVALTAELTFAMPLLPPLASAASAALAAASASGAPGSDGATACRDPARAGVTDRSMLPTRAGWTPSTST